jgi:Serine/Threonine/Tyrosine Kinase found in polyvalent proteins
LSVPATNRDEDAPYPDDGQSVFPRGDARCTLEKLLERASEFDRTTSPSGDAEEWFRAESESLLQWAHERGCFIPPAEFRALIGGLIELEGGNEHFVFFKRSLGRVLKVTKPPHFGYMWHLLGYVQNLVWHNAVFEDRFELVGITQSDEGVSIVVSQPYVAGVSPTAEEIATWFEIQGFERQGQWSWKRPDGIFVSDAHPGNLIKMEGGHLVPIDLQLRVPQLPPVEADAAE